MKSISGNTNYMIDFMSVLEEDSNNQKSVKNNNTDQSSGSGVKKNQVLALTNGPSLKYNA